MPRVWNASLVTIVGPQYIKWPDANETNKIIENFYRKGQIRGVVGVIDCTHIRIKKPVHDQEVYCNRKGYHSIILQAVCDDKKRFIDVCCGEAGSLHDARCLRRSNIHEKCQNRQFPIGNHFLIGDSAYPVLSWLIPPFKDNGHLSHNHHIFNHRHSQCRIVIEQAFGLLKCRFRKLLHIFENRNIDFIVLCSIGACVLHNICIDKKDLEDIQNDNSDNDEIPEYVENNILEDEEQPGINKRSYVRFAKFGPQIVFLWNTQHYRWGKVRGGGNTTTIGYPQSKAWLCVTSSSFLLISRPLHSDADTPRYALRSRRVFHWPYESLHSGAADRHA
ncbi:hypothetical protein NQ315_003265 [Exocentrus adspersus]|uniref:DDE Tnp4 domain-containing protein n=1 Tax=Exocentrus adspersus TaxID=1586481 RepID=A0AAV8VCZ5_9CUCU|nr:hypothetical protein NQ315_003265 [Exocentrus adspersus]